MKWLSTRELAKLIEDQYPATEATIREWCEEGFIPPEIAKRTHPVKEKSRWAISIQGIKWILKDLLKLNDSEINKVKQKAKFDFDKVA